MITRNIMVVGVGGQGTLLISRIMGELFLGSGYDVKVSEVHGMSQRGGSVVTFIRYGNVVAEPIVEEGQADILIAFEKLEAYRNAHYLNSKGIIILNDFSINPMPVQVGEIDYPDNIIADLSTDYSLIHMKAMDEAVRSGNKKVCNVIILGLVAQNMNFEKGQWLDAVKKCVPKNMIDINVNAFLKGYEFYDNNINKNMQSVEKRNK